jgi:hypothetical protein
MSTVTASAELICDGMCKEWGGHKGAVKRYLVSGNGHPENEYHYCDVAAALDRENGFELAEPARPAVYRCDPILSLEEEAEVTR